jgi:hypothetical protein
LDGDGNLDFVEGNAGQGNRVWLGFVISLFAVGEGVGGGGQVKVSYAGDGSERFTLTPFAGFAGEVRVAVADVNGDHIPDIITAPGPGLAARVRVFSGLEGSLLFSPLDDLIPFAANFSKGLYVAAGDVKSDGLADLFVSQGKGNKVRIIDGLTGGLLRTVKPFGNL